jgi:hypothetical protein
MKDPPIIVSETYRFPLSPPLRSLLFRCQNNPQTLLFLDLNFVISDSNTNGSYYYSNDNGSSYYNPGSGSSSSNGNPGQSNTGKK